MQARTAFVRPVLLALALFAAAASQAGPRHAFEYAWHVPPPADGGFSLAEAGDFDGDGLEDVFGYAGSARAYILFQRADGQLPDLVTYDLYPFDLLDRVGELGFAMDSAVVDIDRDGRDEIVMTGLKGLAVFHVGADRSLSWDADRSDSRHVHSAPHVVDVDGDGHWDVVTNEFSPVGRQPSELVVRFGDGSGRFPSRTLQPIGTQRYRWFESGDTNGDGHLDLLAIGNPRFPYIGGPVVIHRGDGRRGFPGPDTSVTGLSATDFLFRDVNGDGRGDLLLVDPHIEDYRYQAGYLQGHLYHQGPDGLPSAPTERVLMRGGTVAFDLVDVDGDGALDLSYLTENASSRLLVNLQREGRLQDPVVSQVPLATVQGSAFDRDSVAYGDFNNDGLPDVVIAGQYGGLVVLHGALASPDAAVAVPGAPRNPVASGYDWTSNVRLAFDAPASVGGGPLLRYEVDADPRGGIWDANADSEPLALVRAMVGQVNDTPYRYRVRAVNAGGAGPWSAWSAPYHVRQLPNFQVQAEDVFETDGVARFVVSLDEGPALSGGVRFDVATRDGTAVAGQDYVAVSRAGVTIPQGEREVVVEVPLIADDVFELGERFQLAISNIQGAQPSMRSYGEVLIRNDPPVSALPRLEIFSYSVLEGNFGSQVMRFRLQLSRPSVDPVTFNLATYLGSASPGTDYVARQESVTLAPGQTLHYFDVEAFGDLQPEDDEYFRVLVTDVVGAINANFSAYGVLVNDDTPMPVVPTLNEASADKGRLDHRLRPLPVGATIFHTTALVRPDLREVLLGQDPTPDLAFDGLAAGTAVMTTQVPANTSEDTVEMRLLVVAESATANRLRLHVGRGTAPEASSATCMSTRNGAGQVCEVVLSRPPGAPAVDYWVLVQNIESGATGMDAVQLEAGTVTMVARDDDFFAGGMRFIGDTHIELRMGWDSPGFEPGQRRLGYLLVEAIPGVQVFQEPIRLRRTSTEDAAHVMAIGEPREVHLGAGEAHERLVVDVPANAAGAVFSTEGEGEVSLYATHVPSPAGPAIEPAPPRSAAHAQASAPGADQLIVLEGDQLPPGRWYLTPVNRGPAPAVVKVRADIVAAGERPAFRPGHYYNPSRPGHGLFLDFAGDQWVMVWYTYLQDGTPTWYYTQGPAPAPDQSQWSVDLMRVTRDSFTSPTRANDVGGATLTILPGPAGASPKLAFGYNVDGDAGWEMLTRLGDDRCPRFNGAALDASGHWYAPSQVGDGISAQLLPNTEVYAVYSYDGLGFPRWLIGQKDYDPTVGPVTLQQLSGFCPTCPAVTVASQSVGVLTRQLASSSHIDGQPGLGSVTTFAALAPPLVGGLGLSVPVYLLSARKGCE